jgi:uncharacterized protein (DUF697 family)
MSTEDELGRAVGGLAGGVKADKSTLAQVARMARQSMKAAGTRSLATGQWLAEVALDSVPHIPVRDATTLSALHGYRTGDRLAEEVIRAASHTTAGLGAVAGALAGAQELVPPTWVAIPAELLVETLAVVAVEMKLVAELQEVYGMPVEGTPAERSTAIVRAWAEGRGVTARNLVKPGGLAQVFGRGTRRELTRMLQRRLAFRAMRNMSALIPLMAGAVAGAELNRRATRSLGDKIKRDLSPSRRRTVVAQSREARR